MPNNLSPWIDQLKHLKTKRVPNILTNDHKTHIAIVGAGIAGVTTAYFILKNTNFDVALIEATKVAHGATGHNAGQVVSYFEQQLSGLVKKYGLQKAVNAQQSIDSAWLLLEQIYNDTQIQTPLAQFTGYAGCQDLNEVLVHLENIEIAKNCNLQYEPLIIAQEFNDLNKIPSKYQGLYSVLPQKDVLSLLETENKNYIAVLSARKGCLNSALFCEDLVDYLIQNFGTRFVLLEHSPVNTITLNKTNVFLQINNNIVTADKVVLCTNGFENFDILSSENNLINQKFHKSVMGAIGYMAGYLEEHQHSPVAISYLPKSNNNSEQAFDSEPYFYLTRRNFEKQNNKYSLICVGGPEDLVEDTTSYKKDHLYPDEAQSLIDNFLHKTYKYAPKKIDYKYKWHGLMGYTPNGIRYIKVDSSCDRLLYNLGCNGVGILPSIYGGKRISELLSTSTVPDGDGSIFEMA